MRFKSPKSFLVILLSANIHHLFAANPTDIVGRELDIPGLGWVGHVGIVTADRVWDKGEYVLEALNEPLVLQINNISNFKKRSAYWGAKFGINQNDNSGTRIINEGAFQTSLKCSTYTKLPKYQPGSGQWGLPSSCPVFRCDTFVNYLYMWGGYKLPTYNPPDSDAYNSTLPKLVFNAFPYYRKEVKNSLNNETYPIINSEDNVPSTEQVQRYIEKEDNTFTEVDTDNLIKLLYNKKLGKEQNLLLLDKLGFIEKPSQLPQLITLYYQYQYDEDLSYLVLRNTQMLYQGSKNFGSFISEKNLLRKFYIRLLNSKLDSKSAHIVIRGILTLCSKNTIFSNRSKIDLIFKNNIKNTDIELALKSLLSFKSASLEKIYIPEILYALENSHNLSREIWFAGTITSYLMTNGPNSLLPQTKSLLHEHLEKVEEMLNDDSKNTNSQHFLYPQAHGIWLEAISLVSSESFDEAIENIEQYIKNFSKEEKKKYLLGFSFNHSGQGNQNNQFNIKLNYIFGKKQMD